MSHPWNWTIENLEELIGQSESLRLDFKQSRLFNESRERIIENLTKEVSAFSNTEGGIIVVGIKEKKVGRTKVANEIDEGIDFLKWSPEQIQQMIESNIRPYLTGLRFKTIPLGDNRKRFALVISVPQGTTAYQASDFRYYGRSEYESKALPDHHIRLLMSRGKVPQAIVIVDDLIEEIIAVQKDKKKKILENQAEDFREVLDQLNPGDSLPVRRLYFSFFLKNTGDINISEFKVQIDFPQPNKFELWNYSKTYKDGWPDASYGLPVIDVSQMKYQKVNIFPEDRFSIKTFEINLPTSKSVEKINIEASWILYLTNTMPVRGKINLAEEFIRRVKIEEK